MFDLKQAWKHQQKNVLLRASEKKRRRSFRRTVRKKNAINGTRGIPLPRWRMTVAV
jgi:hypothetical protein